MRWKRGEEVSFCQTPSNYVQALFSNSRPLNNVYVHVWPFLPRIIISLNEYNVLWTKCYTFWNYTYFVLKKQRLTSRNRSIPPFNRLTNLNEFGDTYPIYKLFKQYCNSLIFEISFLTIIKHQHLPNKIKNLNACVLLNGFNAMIQKLFFEIFPVIIYRKIYLNFEWSDAIRYLRLIYTSSPFKLLLNIPRVYFTISYYTQF